MKRIFSIVLSFIFFVAIPLLPTFSQDDGGKQSLESQSPEAQAAAKQAWTQLLAKLDKELPTMSEPPSKSQIYRDYADLLSAVIKESKIKLMDYEVRAIRNAKTEAFKELAAEYSQKFNTKRSTSSGSKEELQPIVFNTREIISVGWMVSKDDDSSRSNALLFASAVSKGSLDEKIKVKGIPDFVAFNYCVNSKYPAVALIWTKTAEVLSIRGQYELDGKATFDKTQPLNDWIADNKIEDNLTPPRLTESLKECSLRAQHDADVAKSKEAEIRKKRLEALQPELARLKNTAEQHKDDTLVFKSFYMGMPIEDAATLTAFYLEKDTNNAGLPIEGYSGGKWFKDADSGLRVAADNDGKVIAIYLPKKCVAMLFKSNDLDTKSFIETFQKSYGLPHFSPADGPVEVFSKTATVGHMDGISPVCMKFAEQEKWTATSDKGFSATIYGAITVTDKKTLLQFNMADAITIIPDGSLLIRKINKAAFD